MLWRGKGSWDFEWVERVGGEVGWLEEFVFMGMPLMFIYVNYDYDVFILVELRLTLKADSFLLLEFIPVALLFILLFTFLYPALFPTILSFS
jgi:hypothetical protein